MKKIVVVGVLAVAGLVIAVAAAPEAFFCKYCGMKFGSVRSLTASNCQRHPDGPGKGRHALYEGTTKASYTCKFCGQKSNDLRSLTGSKCQRHPNGPYKGPHSPAL